MGIGQWEWEGMGILIVFLHTSSLYYQHATRGEAARGCSTQCYLPSKINSH